MKWITCLLWMVITLSRAVVAEVITPLVCGLGQYSNGERCLTCAAGRYGDQTGQTSSACRFGNNWIENGNIENPKPFVILSLVIHTFITCRHVYFPQRRVCSRLLLSRRVYTTQAVSLSRWEIWRQCWAVYLRVFGTFARGILCTRGLDLSQAVPLQHQTKPALLPAWNGTSDKGAFVPMVRRMNIFALGIYADTSKRKLHIAQTHQSNTHVHININIPDHRWKRDISPLATTP